MSSRLRLATVATGVAALLALAGCSGDPGSSDPSDPGTSGDSAAFEPVSIEHAFGTAEITEQPVNVVTLGWGSAEAAIALGVVPVGIERQSYAADENGQLPWVAEALADADTQPTMISSTVEEPAYDEINALAPDVILAPYSGLTQEQWAILDEIAPTVAYPEVAWATPWRDVISIVGESLGLPDEAATLVEDIDATVAEAAAAHPELAGKTVAAVWDIGGTFWVYKGADSRVDFLTDLGLVSSPAVETLATDDETFTFALSYEQTDQLEADILVNYASTDAEVQTFLGQSYAQAIPAVASGAVANIIGDQLIAAMSPPTALSVNWGLDEYVQLISEAAANVG